MTSSRSQFGTPSEYGALGDPWASMELDRIAPLWSCAISHQQLRGLIVPSPDPVCNVKKSESWCLIGEAQWMSIRL